MKGVGVESSVVTGFGVCVCVSLIQLCRGGIPLVSLMIVPLSVSALSWLFRLGKRGKGERGLVGNSRQYRCTTVSQGEP